MPVFFDNVNGGGALAFTNNVTNALVDGNTLFVANIHGPTVSGSNLFNDYVQHVVSKPYLYFDENTGNYILKNGDFTSVFFADERYYHNWEGSIHCGTNVLRKIPQSGSGKEWWVLFEEVVI
jgi:hypothetical protein